MPTSLGFTDDGSIQTAPLEGEHPCVRMSGVAAGVTTVPTTYKRGTVLALDGDGNYVPVDPSASDTTVTAVAILADDITLEVASTEEPCSVYVHGSFIAASLVYANTMTDAQKTTALSELAAKTLFCK